MIRENIRHDSLCSFACHVEHRFHNNILYFSLGFLSNGLLASIIFVRTLANNVSILSIYHVNSIRCKHRLCVSKSSFSYWLYRILVLLVVQSHVSSYFLVFSLFHLIPITSVIIPARKHNPVFIHQSLLKHSLSPYNE